MIVVEFPPQAPDRWIAFVQAANRSVPLNARVACSFVPVSRIRKLNRRYRSIDQPTNVLTFGWKGEDSAIIGDILLCRSVIRSEAPGVRFRKRFDHLFVHGLLHVLGFNHERGERASRAMERLETTILGWDPYIIHPINKKTKYQKNNT